MYGVRMRPPESPAPRRNLRVPARTEFVPEGSATPRFLGYVANLSETGAFVQSSNPRPVGTKLCMIIHLERHSFRIVECEAEVMWVRGYAGNEGPSPGMGVRFFSVDATMRAALRAFCQALDPLAGPPPAQLLDTSR
jgi:Tfp pilus assembly protein PilZ